MQWSTHVDCKNGTNTNSKDWTFKLRHTKDGGYIAAGYSKSDVNNAMVPCLYRLDPNGNLLWQHIYTFGTANITTWNFNDVIEDANGNFAAVGAIDPSGGTNNPARAILVITGPDGSISNAPYAELSLLAVGSDEYTLDAALGVVETPDGKYAIAVVGHKYLGPKSGFIVITDGFSGALPDYWQYPVSTYNNLLNAIKLGNVNSSTDYDLIACGQQITSTTTITGCLSCEASPCTTLTRQATTSDVIVASVNWNGSSLTGTWTYQTAHSLFYPNYVYVNDYGPYSITNGTNCTSGTSGCDHNSAFYDNMIRYSKNDLGSDLLINQNNEIVIAAFTDLLWQDDDPWYSTSVLLRDCARACTTIYDEYKDANAWLLKLNYSDGSVSSNNSHTNPAHIAHFSGDDFRTEIGEDACGNIYIDGSTADNNFTTPESDDLLPMAVKADMLVCKVDQYFTKVWRKHFSSSGLHQPLQSCSPYDPYDYDCGFGLVVNSDNSITVCGNNGERDDDAVFTKLSSDEQTLKSDWDYPTGYTASAGTTTWPTGTVKTIKGTLRIPSGATLTIANSTIEFAETREVIDYNDPNVNANQCGIVVEKGGSLVVINGSILRGLEMDVNSDCSRDYMWDGITVEGDPSLTQTSAHQGSVRLRSDATIQDARCGVRVDSKTYFNNQPEEYGYDLTPALIDTWDRGRLSYASAEGHGGGIVDAHDSHFINNRKDVEFLPYPSSNLSEFNTNEFICNAPMVDPDFVDFDIAIVTYVPSGVNTHVSMWDVHGIPFEYCIFENSGSFNPKYRGTGIESLDAEFSSYYSEFNTLTYGIHAEATNSIYAPYIEHSTFYDNPHGIYELGIDMSTIILSHFYVVAGDDIRNYGIYLEDCTGYTIEQNDMYHSKSTTASFGIIDYFTYTNYNPDLIYNNTFDGFLGAAIQAEGFHYSYGDARIGLMMKCNTYSDNAYDENVPYLGLTSDPEGIAQLQGNYINATAPANNIFDWEYGCYTSVNGQLEGELRNESDPNILSFNYYHSPDNTSAHYNVAPDNGCYTASWVLPFLVGSSPFIPSVNCPPNYDLPRLGRANASLINNYKLKGTLFPEKFSNRNLRNGIGAISSDSLTTDSLNQLAYYYAEYSRLLDHEISSSMKDSMITNGLNNVISLLQNDSTIGRRMQLIDALIANNNLISADSVVTILNANPDLSNYCMLQNSLIGLKQQGKTLFDFKNDSLLYQNVITIASDSVHAGYSKARAILTVIEGRHYPEVIKFDLSPSAGLRREEIMFAKGLKLLRNYPNPFNSGTIIEAQVDDALKDPKLVVYDMIGKAIKIMNLHGGFNDVNISEADIKPGIYFYSIVSGNKRIATEKMICTR